MNRSLSAFARLLILLLGLHATTTPALPLWELTGTENQVMVLGSIHFLRDSDYPLAPAIMQAFEEAEVVVMEIDMDDLDPLSGAAAIATLARDPDGRQLPELLGASAWKSTAVEARRLGLDPELLKPFEPWYAAIIVTQLRLTQLGFDQSLGIESALAADAAQEGKEIRGLETLEGQLGMLDGLSAGAQRDFLRQTLEEAGEVAEVADDMIHAWKRGDVAAMDEDLLDGVRQQPELYRALILERNRHFAEAIAGFADDGEDYLVIVGALHLVGPDSVLRMLAREGIESRQVEGRRTATD